MPLLTQLRSILVTFALTLCATLLSSCGENSDQDSDSAAPKVAATEPSDFFGFLSFEEKELGLLRDHFQNHVAEIGDSHFVVYQLPGKKVVRQMKGMNLDAIKGDFEPSEADVLNGVKRMDTVFVRPLPITEELAYREAAITHEGEIGSWEGWQMASVGGSSDDNPMFEVFYILIQKDGEDLGLHPTVSFVGKKVRTERISKELNSSIRQSL